MAEGEVVLRVLPSQIWWLVFYDVHDVDVVDQFILWEGRNFQLIDSL